MAEAFAEQFNITFPLYTDPERVTYRSMNFTRSFGISFGSVGYAKRAFQKGFTQGKVAGDPWQQGGEALIEQNGNVHWKHAAKAAGSHASVSEIRQVVTSFLLERQ